MKLILILTILLGAVFCQNGQKCYDTIKTNIGQLKLMESTLKGKSDMMMTSSLKSNIVNINKIFVSCEPSAQKDFKDLPTKTQIEKDCFVGLYDAFFLVAAATDHALNKEIEPMIQTANYAANKVKTLRKEACSKFL